MTAIRSARTALANAPSVIIRLSLSERTAVQPNPPVKPRKTKVYAIFRRDGRLVALFRTYDSARNFIDRSAMWADWRIIPEWLHD